MSNQATPLKVSYDAAELESLVESLGVLHHLIADASRCAPASDKLISAAIHLSRRQRELVAEALAAPEVL